MALPAVTTPRSPAVVASVAEVLLSVIVLLPPMVKALLSLKVILPRFMSAPTVTLDVAPVAPKMTLTPLPPGTTPPAEVPAASEAQLLEVPAESAMTSVAPTS